MLVREVMTKNVVTIDENKSVYDACMIYKNKAVGSLIVTKNKNHTGIITERNLIERTICEKRDPAKTLVSDIMTKDVKTVNPLDSIENSLEKMKEYNIKKLPVVMNEEIVGIITVTDISRARPNLSERFMDSWVKPRWED